MGMPHCSRVIKLPTASGNVGNGLPTDTGHYVNITGLVGLETGGTNPVSVVIRQGGSTGTVVATLTCATSSVGASATPINAPVKVNTPVYCQLIGTGTFDGAIHII